MTIDDSKNKITQMFANTITAVKRDISAIPSTFANELQSQLANTNSNPNKPAETESSESDTVLEEFKSALTSKGALAFLQDFNNEKIEKMIEEKKAELMEKLGLDDSTQPPLSGEARTEALASLDQMLDDFRKQLMEKLNADDKLEQQNTMLSTFLQTMN